MKDQEGTGTPAQRGDAPSRPSPPSPLGPECAAPSGQAAAAEGGQQTVPAESKLDRDLVRWTRALAFFTAALVLVAGLQFLAMRGQLSVMKGTLREMQTADAITKSQISARMEFEIHRQEEVVGQTVVAWSVTPVWKNTGQTDALDFFGLDNIKYFPGNSASSFDFASFPKQPKGIVPATITSKQWISQPTRVISRTEAIKAAAGDGTIIFWGYARWRDIFPDVPPHFHSWCALLHFSMANGQPIMTLPVYYEAQCNRSH